MAALLKPKNKNKRGLIKKQRPNPAYSSNAVIPRMNFNFDGQMLNGLQFGVPALTLTNGAAAIHLLDCSNTATNGITANILVQSVSQTLSGITARYAEYIYRAVTFTWMPFVAPGVADGGSQIYVAYQDNPENLASLAISSVTAIFDSAKASRNMKCFNAWERFSYTVPISARRKSFDVNTTTTIGATDTYDRSVQGAVIVGYSSLSASATLGQWKISYHLELRRLNNVNTT